MQYTIHNIKGLVVQTCLEGRPRLAMGAGFLRVQAAHAASGDIRRHRTVTRSWPAVSLAHKPRNSKAHWRMYGRL
jgi:hypothetical protein